MKDQNMNNDSRNRINAGAGRLHELSRQILNVDWFDTESQARRVIEHFAEAESQVDDAERALSERDAEIASLRLAATVSANDANEAERAAQREMERHRKTWRQLEQVTGLLKRAKWKLWASPGDTLPDDITAALSQQAEPVECPVCCSDEPHTGTCGSSDPRALYNRAWAEPVEPAPAQDEREAYEAWRDSNTQNGRTDVAGHHAFKAGAAWCAARLTQTEQQPIAHVSEETFSSDGTSDIITCNLPIGMALYATPFSPAMRRV